MLVLPGIVVGLGSYFVRPVPLGNCSGGARNNNTREVVTKDVRLCRRGGNGRGVPRLEGRDSIQDPLAIASKARSVILPSLG